MYCTSGDKKYGLDKVQQRQEMWAGQGPAETRDVGLDKAQQRQEIWAGQVPAETRDMGWTRPSRDKRYGVSNSRQGQENFLRFKSPPLALIHIPSVYSTDNGVKMSGCDFDHSSPSSGEVMNEWSYTSASPVLRGA